MKRRKHVEAVERRIGICCDDLHWASSFDAMTGAADRAMLSRWKYSCGLIKLFRQAEGGARASAAFTFIATRRRRHTERMGVRRQLGEFEHIPEAGIG